MSKRDKIIQLLGTMPPKAIAERLNCHPAYVRAVKQTLPTHKPSRRRVFDREQMLKLHKVGLNDVEISRAIGSSVQIVHRWRHSAGLPTV